MTLKSYVIFVQQGQAKQYSYTVARWYFPLTLCWVGGGGDHIIMQIKLKVSEV
jgi:hypothetical protein